MRPRFCRVVEGVFGATQYRSRRDVARLQQPTTLCDAAMPRRVSGEYVWSSIRVAHGSPRQQAALVALLES